MPGTSEKDTMTNEFKELEFKYNAGDVKLQDFIKLAEKLKPTDRLNTSSFDYYYTSSTPDEFIRYRESDEPELTIKRKVKTSNNWERVEVDLPLDNSRVTKNVVDNWVKLEGYSENFSIFKSCFIFWYDLVNAVYYVVYDNDMKECGRFIEIEVNKERVNGLGLSKAFEKLKEFEKELATLGLNPQNRLRKSLFEMFAK